MYGVPLSIFCFHAVVVSLSLVLQPCTADPFAIVVLPFLCKALVYPGVSAGLRSRHIPTIGGVMERR